MTLDQVRQVCQWLQCSELDSHEAVMFKTLESLLHASEERARRLEAITSELSKLRSQLSNLGFGRVPEKAELGERINDALNEAGGALREINLVCRLVGLIE